MSEDSLAYVSIMRFYNFHDALPAEALTHMRKTLQFSRVNYINYFIARVDNPNIPSLAHIKFQYINAIVQVKKTELLKFVEYLDKHKNNSYVDKIDVLESLTPALDNVVNLIADKNPEPSVHYIIFDKDLLLYENSVALQNMLV